MILINSYLGLQLIIDEDLMGLFKKEARKFYPNEYGGLLIGKYNDNRTNLFITNTILSSAKKLSRTKFDRVFNEGELRSFYEQNPSLGYVGEWHSHPNCLCFPSITDFKAMNEIANCESVVIKNPILLIISVYKQSFNICFYVYFENKIYSYTPVN